MAALNAYTRFSDQVVVFNAEFDETALIEHSKISLEIIKDEVSEIWGKTKAAYDKCVLVNTQLKILFSIPVIQSETVSTLKYLYRIMNECISALAMYEVDVTKWNPFLVFSIYFI